MCEASFAAAVCMSLVHAAAHAQDFSPKQITVVVGFPAAGGTDLFARLFAQKLATGLGTIAIVDNRPGAAGTLGTSAVVTPTELASHLASEIKVYNELAQRLALKPE